MPVTQQFIDLLNMPLGRLKRLSMDLGVEPPSSVGKWELAEQLSEYPRDQLLDLAGDWLFAGSTSVTWFVLGEGNGVTPEAWATAVNDYINGDVAGGDIRPDDITHRPQLVDMRTLGDDKIVCTFAVARRVSRVIHNFEVDDVLADEFFVAMLRPGDGVVEVRASHDRARTLASTWLSEVAARIEEQEVRA